jgi:hypothetical protein
MFGVPFSLMRDLFFFPRRDTIEAVYRALPPRSNPTLPTLAGIRGQGSGVKGEAAGKPAG